jgi:hypothetical protein
MGASFMLLKNFRQHFFIKVFTDFPLICFNIISMLAFYMSVDWRSRHYAFRGRVPRSLLSAKALAGSPQPRTPAGLWITSSNMPTHEGNAIAFSRSLRAFRANQRVFSIKSFSSTNKLSLLKLNVGFNVFEKINGRIPSKLGNTHISRKINGVFPFISSKSLDLALFREVNRNISAYFDSLSIPYIH